MVLQQAQASANHLADIIESADVDLFFHKELKMRTQRDTGWHNFLQKILGTNNNHYFGNISGSRSHSCEAEAFAARMPLQQSHPPLVGATPTKSGRSLFAAQRFNLCLEQLILACFALQKTAGQGGFFKQPGRGEQIGVGKWVFRSTVTGDSGLS